MSLRQGLLQATVRSALQVHASCERQLRRVHQLVSGAALAGLAPAALRAVTVRAYRNVASYQSSGLFAWEEPWFRADLPAPPARILVGAAGTGREVAWLDARGYTTVAFDPVAEAVAEARQRTDVPGCLAFLEGGFEEVIAPAGEEPGAVVRQIADLAPYDAVLLGWGGINHLPRPAARRDLLCRLRELCPAGPVLLSFWLRDPGADEPSRPWRLGWQLGAWLAGRPVGDQAEVVGDMFVSHAGYAHRFSEAEIRALAEASGYVVAGGAFDVSGAVHPHATLIPR
jgi:SAM-dependent methyltransferase